MRTFGVTVALRAAYVDAALQGGREVLRSEVRNLADQATEALKAYVGGAPFRSELAVSLNGLEADPLQGMIYGLSVAALFDIADLGTDCPARLLIMQEQAEGAGAVDVAQGEAGL